MHASVETPQKQLNQQHEQKTECVDGWRDALVWGEITGRLFKMAVRVRSHVRLFDGRWVRSRLAR